MLTRLRSVNQMLFANGSRQHPGRSAWVATGIVVALFVMLCLRATPRVTGDGAEYILLAERFSQGQSPNIPVEVARAHGLFEPRLVDLGGAQQLWHFWFLPLLVAPVLRVLAHEPTIAFTIVNIGLLGLALNVVYRRLGPLATLYIAASPILWWLDKAQVEAFTVAMVAIGCASVGRPHVAAVAFAVAATQNPPFAVISLVLCIAAVLHAERRERLKVWLFCVLALLTAALHPLFYLWRLGRWTPLVETSDARIPGLRALLTVIIDLNIGMMVNAPFVLVVLLVVAAAAVRQADWRTFGANRRLALSGGIAALFLFACAQAPNVNSGGTPGMMRYALWFIPLPLLLWPLLENLKAGSRTLLCVVTIASAVWSLLFFQPARADNYLSPTRIAAWVWSEHPSWENPLPEIFAERLRHKDGVNTLAATPNCAKALLLGGQWPAPCQPETLPGSCQQPGALCYANRRADGAYQFVETSRRGGIRLSALVP